MADGLHERTRGLLAKDPSHPPCLASIHLNAATPFSVYLKRQERAAALVGIRFRSEALGTNPTSADLLRRVRGLENDPSVDAILIEHPLPAELDFLGATSALSLEKDVDGVGPLNLGRLVSYRPVHVPAVARAAFEILRFYDIPIEGRRVAVLGRSETVGLPIALLALSRGKGGNATVTIAHSQSPDLASAISGSEIVFSCVGRPGLLDRRLVPRGACVVDVGLSMVPDPAKPGSLRGQGDADAESLEGWASALTPVRVGSDPCPSPPSC